MTNDTIDIESKFEARPYQENFLEAFRSGKYKRFVYISGRRSGKDCMGLECTLEGALSRIGTYLYVLPTYESCRGIIWENIMANGIKLLDYVIDPRLIASKNEQQMAIKLHNGSRIKLVGSDNYNNSLVGRGAAGMVFSEFAIQDPMAWEFASPLIAETDGWAIFVSTVRGRNHLFDLYEQALNDPLWYTELLTYDQTNHLSKEAWAQEQSKHSWDYIQQEYFCNFNLGIVGTIYGKYVDKMKLNGQIGNVNFNPKYRVNTAWDIGNDTTSIILFSIEGTNIKIFDYIEDKNKNLEHYVSLLNEKEKDNGYIYGKHFFPHDMMVNEWAGPRFSRKFKAEQMGLKNVIIVPKVSHEDGIEWVRSKFPDIYIDEKRCSQLIKCLENYRYELNVERKEYSRLPVHNWASHGASAMKYLCLGIPQAGTETTPEQLKERYNRVMGKQYEQPSVESIFRM